MGNAYLEECKRRIFQSRFKERPLQHIPLQKIDLNFTKDWFPSEPYKVIIDDNLFCANIKIDRDNVHFHLVCGYNILNENPGKNEFFAKHFKHLIMPKERVHVFDAGKLGWIFLVQTMPYDWERFYQKGDSESKHMWHKYHPPWDAYNWYVDWLLTYNKRKLTSLGKGNYLERRSDGEKAIANTLKEIGIRYIPEYIVEGLTGDEKAFRIADFYLPRENIIIEFCGGWDKYDKSARFEERQRYENKKKVYEKNKISALYIYPEHLNKVAYVLSVGISKIINEGGSFGNSQDSKDFEEILELKNKIEELENKRIINRIKSAIVFIKKIAVKT